MSTVTEVWLARDADGMCLWFDHESRWDEGDKEGGWMNAFGRGSQRYHWIIGGDEWSQDVIANGTKQRLMSGACAVAEAVIASVTE